MLLSEAIEALAFATKADGRSPRTIATYRQKCRTLLDFLGDVDVKEITTADLRRWIVQMRDSDLSEFTTAGRVRHVKRLLNFLDEEGEIEDNPAKSVRTPAPRREKPKAISPEDIERLLEDAQGESLKDLRDYSIILLLADAGLRAGGLVGLEVDDLDLESCTGLVMEKGGKTRTAIFGEVTAEALRAWIQAAGLTEGPLFPGLGPRSRGALTTGGLHKMLSVRAKRAGCEEYTNPHAFRHFYGREYLRNGGDLSTLARLLGHSTVQVTHDFYAVFTLPELTRKHHQHSPLANVLNGGDRENGQSGGL